MYLTYIALPALVLGYPQQTKQPAPTNPPVPVTGVFDQGARIDPNKPITVPVSKPYH